MLISRALFRTAIPRHFSISTVSRHATSQSQLRRLFSSQKSREEQNSADQPEDKPKEKEWQPASEKEGNTSTAYGYTRKKQADGSASAPTEVKIDSQKLQQAEQVKYEKDYELRTFEVLESVLPISDITKHRKGSLLVAGLWISLAATAYYYGYPVVAGGLCFMAAGPIMFFRRSKTALKDKVLGITLLPDMKNVLLHTAFYTQRVSIDQIKPLGDFISMFETARPKFEMVKSPEFNPPTEIVPSGYLLFFGVQDPQTGQLKKMLVDLDHLLYRVDNFDLLVDILTGQHAEVYKYYAGKELLTPKEDLIREEETKKK